MENRVATLDKVGTEIKGSNNVDEILNKAGLNYTVCKQPLYLPNGLEIPDKVATIRETDNGYIGVVGRNYEVVQNRDAFDFIDCITDKVEFVKGGQTSKGSAYLIGKMDDCEVLGDKFTPYIIFRNSFDGTTPIQAAICPLRIVCQNQFNYSFANTNNTVIIKHNSKANDRLIAARKVLSSAAEFMKDLTRQAERYANVKVNANTAFSIVERLFPVTADMSVKVAERAEMAKQRYLEALNSEDNRNFKGTLWGMVNAYTDYLTHAPIIRKTETANESKFLAVTFNPNFMKQFMTVAESAIAA